MAEQITDPAAISVGNGLLQKVQTSDSHTRRTNKISHIQRDKQIFADMIKRYEGGEEPAIKSSLAFKLFRAYETQADEMPNTYPVKEGAGQAELNAIDSAKDIIYTDSRLTEVYQEMIQRNFRTDGTTFLEYGYDTEGDFIPVRSCEFADCYTDYDKDTLATDAADFNPTHAKWWAHKVGLTLAEFGDLFPDAEGVLPGDPTVQNRAGANNATVNNTEVTPNSKVFVLYAYTIEGVTPVMKVIAGSNQKEIQHLTGKDYPFWVKRQNGKEYPTLPCVDFHFTRAGGEGICTMSQIGMLADLSGVDEEITTTALPSITRAVNKIWAVFSDQATTGGTPSGTAQEQIDIGWKMARLGRPTLVTMDTATSIQSISPDAGIIAEFDAARNLIYRMASDRFGINFLELSSDEVKATVFVGKTKAEIQAVNGLYRVNRDKFNQLANKLVSLAGRTWRGDSRIVEILVDEESGETVQMEAGEIMQTLSEWDGYFETDVDLKMPPTTADKNNAIAILEAEKTRIYYSKPWGSVEEIMDEIDALVERARLTGLEDLYNKRILVKKAMIIKQEQRNMAIEAEGAQEANLIEGGAGDVNQDVATELSPNRALAEAGLS